MDLRAAVSIELTWMAVATCARGSSTLQSERKYVQNFLLSSTPQKLPLSPCRMQWRLCTVWRRGLQSVCTALAQVHPRPALMRVLKKAQDVLEDAQAHLGASACSKTSDAFFKTRTRAGRRSRKQRAAASVL